MPIFEYRCARCARVSEFLIGVSQEKKDIVCPHCGGTKLSRLISAGNVGRAAARHCAMKDFPCATGGCDAGACPAGGCPGG